VIGTSRDYFERFRHSGGQSLTFESGADFDGPEGAVIGAEVAEKFGYSPGSEIINAHGSGVVAFDVHDEAPFTVTGVLGPTGTSVDRMVFVSLEGFDSLHEDPVAEPVDPFASPEELANDVEHGLGDGHKGEEAREEHNDHDDHAVEDGHQDHDDHDEHLADDAHEEHDSGAHDEHADHGHEPGTINAIYAGLTDKAAVLSVQRQLAEYRSEALSAVLPNVALLQLWSLTDTAETALRLMAGAVAVAGMIGMVVMLSAALDARRREFAILRSVGATPGNIFGLIVLEAVLLLLSGIVLGYLVLSAATAIIDPVLASNFGLRIGLGLPTFREGLLIALVFCSGLVASAVPALRVYRMTLADGLSMRL